MAISPIRVGIVGMGSMARSHLRNMLPREDTVVIASCEPSPAELELTATEFSRIGLPTPPNEPDFMRFVERFAPELDVIFIITPHVFHAVQTTACLEAGVDVLLEKPMAMNAGEAEALIATRDRTGRLLVIAFPGSLSPQVRAAARMIASGEVGALSTSTPWSGRTGRCRRAGRGARTRRYRAAVFCSIRAPTCSTL